MRRKQLEPVSPRAGDVVPTVSVGGCVRDFSDRADSCNRHAVCGLVSVRYAFRTWTVRKHDAEASVAGEDVLHHCSVSLLENVEGERCVREKDETEWEYRDAAFGAGRHVCTLCFERLSVRE